MTREQRRALLGDKTIEQIHERVAQAPSAPPELIDFLRPILTRPARQTEQPTPAAA